MTGDLRDSPPFMNLGKIQPSWSGVRVFFHLTLKLNGSKSCWTTNPLLSGEQRLLRGRSVVALRLLRMSRWKIATGIGPLPGQTRRHHLPKPLHQTLLRALPHLIMRTVPLPQPRKIQSPVGALRGGGFRQQTQRPAPVQGQGGAVVIRMRRGESIDYTPSDFPHRFFIYPAPLTIGRFLTPLPPFDMHTQLSSLSHPLLSPITYRKTSSSESSSS